MPACTHERLHQVSDAVLRTTWDLGADGAYVPDTEYKVLSEETGTFECVDCGTHVQLDENARLEL